MKVSISASGPPPKPARKPRTGKFDALRRQFRELPLTSWLKVEEVKDANERRAVQQALRREAAALGIGVEVIKRNDLEVWARKKEQNHA